MISKRYIYAAIIGGVAYLLLRKDDGLLPSSIVTGVTKIKNAMGIQKGGINNPGNIRSTAIKWKGELTRPGDAFESYDTIESGIRAMYLNLQSYRNRGLDTISEIIRSWAPPEDKNDTEAYIKTVSKITGIGPVQMILKEHYPAIISAMSKVEGNCYVAPDQVKAVIANV